MVTGSVILKSRSFCQKCVVCSDRWTHGKGLSRRVLLYRKSITWGYTVASSKAANWSDSEIIQGKSKVLYIHLQFFMLIKMTNVIMVMLIYFRRHHRVMENLGDKVIQTKVLGYKVSWNNIERRNFYLRASFLCGARHPLFEQSFLCSERRLFDCHARWRERKQN